MRAPRPVGNGVRIWNAHVSNDSVYCNLPPRMRAWAPPRGWGAFSSASPAPLLRVARTSRSRKAVHLVSEKFDKFDQQPRKPVVRGPGTVHLQPSLPVAPPARRAAGAAPSVLRFTVWVVAFSTILGGCLGVSSSSSMVLPIQRVIRVSNQLAFLLLFSTS